MQSRHFHVANAREMLWDEPEVCPFYGGLTFDGIAVEPDQLGDRLHLIIRTSTARAYLGTSPETTLRRAAVLVAALRHSPQPITGTQAVLIMQWLADCWTAADQTLTELTTARHEGR